MKLTFEFNDDEEDRARYLLRASDMWGELADAYNNLRSVLKHGPAGSGPAAMEDARNVLGRLVLE